jgi:hypothetical protein
MIDRQPLPTRPKRAAQAGTAVLRDPGAGSSPQSLAWHARTAHSRPSGTGIWGISVFTDLRREGINPTFGKGLIMPEVMRMRGAG